MNERLKQLMIEHGLHKHISEDCQSRMEFLYELIVKECYQHCKDQLMDKKLAEHEGLDYNDGVMDCAIGLLQHFGVDK